MNLSKKWLADYIKLDENLTPREFSERMTMSGSKVEGWEFLGEEIRNVVLARVNSIEKHPDSDHLVICQVEIGGGNVNQIVTGAANLTPGDLVPAALPSSTLPGGVKIKSGKLRGVKSDGMLCSFQELGLTIGDVPGACENGILVLDKSLEGRIGEDIRTVLGIDDTVWEFEITSNRPDCFSVIGLAREAAATFETPLNLHTPAVRGGSGDISEYLNVTVEEPALCPRYTARVVKNVKIEPSPAWMRERLRAMGVRPINNIVDITNYVMLEYGQPMHSFDYACLKGSAIDVRLARAGEHFNTLDGQERNLTEDMLVIADSVRPVAVAGVMGGENSEITDATRTVVFESATFNGPSVRITAKKLGMRTDASALFEKGLDVQNTIPALERACELVELLGAGEVVGGMIDVLNADLQLRRLPLECEKINRLIGIDVSRAEMERILTKLGFGIEGDEIVVPSWRPDVERMADVSEEIARFYGYDKIPTTLSAGGSTQGKLTSRQAFERDLAQACRSVGYDEVFTYSFISPKFYDNILLASDSPLRRSVKILNPLGEDLSIMRTTSLPSMLEVIARNANRRNPCAKLYELATVYTPVLTDTGDVDAAALPCESKVLTLAAYGEMDFFKLKGALCAIFKSLKITSFAFEALKDDPSYHPGRCARITLGGRSAGVIGEIHPRVLKNYGLNVPVCAAEIRLDDIESAVETGRVFHALPRFPASSRDIAVVCDESLPVAAIEQCIRESAGKHLESVTLFDVYRGEQLPAGKKSVAYSMSLRASDSTITDEESDRAMNRAIKALEEKLGATLRA